MTFPNHYTIVRGLTPDHHAGHDYGPDTPELRTAAGHLDDAIGWLTDGVAKLGLADRTTYVVVSDHGMAKQDKDWVLFLDDYLSPDEIDVVDWSPNVEINPKDKTTADDIYRKLAGKHPALAVYRKRDLPKWLGYGIYDFLCRLLHISPAQNDGDPEQTAGFFRR